MSFLDRALRMGEAKKFKSYEQRVSQIGAFEPEMESSTDEELRELAAELRERFAAGLKAHSPRDVLHMCGSGVTACHNLLAMEHAGLAGSRIYAPSWSGWIADGKREVAVGAE